MQIQFRSSGVVLERLSGVVLQSSFSQVFEPKTTSMVTLVMKQALEICLLWISEENLSPFHTSVLILFSTFQESAINASGRAMNQQTYVCNTAFCCNHISAWVFSCQFAAYFQNKFSKEHLWRAASGNALVLEETVVGVLSHFVRSICPEVFCKIDVLKNFAKFTRKHLCQSLFLN